MKEAYEAPELDVVSFETEDVLIDSEFETPDYPIKS